MNRILWPIVGILLVALVGVALYKAWPLLFPKVDESAVVDSDCDLRAGPCTSKLPSGGSITFAIEPRDLPVVKPLKLKVDIEGFDGQAVQVDFSGTDMNMGFNRPTLEKIDAQHFAGEGMIPVCVRDAMEWEAKVLVQTASGLVSAPYRFITVRPGVPLPGAESVQ